MLLEGNDGPNDLVEMPTHVTPKLELEEVAADKMDFYDLPRTSVSLKTQCAEEDFGLLERKEHAATLIEPKRDNAIKIAFGATRGNALHVVKFSELTVKNSSSGLRRPVIWRRRIDGYAKRTKRRWAMCSPTPTGRSG
jgi:hypothetical protein